MTRLPHPQGVRQSAIQIGHPDLHCQFGVDMFIAGVQAAAKGR